ncbi:MAG TPA: glycoside hydrolase family 3 protein [Geobacteraceae bacterium]|nr:glycoside hydrolase family 3 protein [Geobacteraceae bacterium]
MRILRYATFTILLFSCLLMTGCGSDPDHYPIDRVEILLSRMSVEEKVGQVIMGFFRGTTLSEEQINRISGLHLGGVILYTGAGNIENTAQVAALNESIQNTAREAGILPLFISIDQEGGLVCRLTEGVTVFPGNMALGATGSESLTAASADVTARELRALGITMNFAPVVDVNSNPANPVIGIRSFGSSPEEVARLGRAVIEPYRQAGVVCTAKHFPGHGDTDIDSHIGLPIVKHDRSRLEEVELYPFRAMVRDGVPAVMTAHVEVPALDPTGLPATLSKPILDILRNEIGFSGLIITDSMGMGAIVQGWGLEEAAVLSFLAGADILLFGADKGHEPAEQDGVYQALLDAVQNGRIPMKRLNDSVRRILAAKLAYGLLDDPFPHENRQAELATSENLATADDVAVNSITLIRNTAKNLPLSGNVPTPIIWPTEMASYLQPLLLEMPNLVPCLAPLQPGIDDIARVAETIAGSPVVVAASYNLDRNPGWLNLLRTINGDNLIVVAVRSPYDLLQIPETATYLATYSDRPVAVRALARLLTGRFTPRGHLPVDLPGLYDRGWGITEF